MVDFPGGVEVLQQWLAILAGFLPPVYLSLLTLLFFSLLLVGYSILVWKFHRLVGRKDFLTLNLAQYNTTDHPFYSKLFAVLLYFAEYILILPIILSIGFSGLAIIILLLSNELAVSQALVVAVAIISCIRILSYYQEDVSREVAKLLPLTLLAIFLITPGFFSLDHLVVSISEIGGLFNQIVYFFLFILSLELILRILDLIFKD